LEGLAVLDLDFSKPITESFPSARELRDTLAVKLREVDVLKKLLPIAERLEEYRAADEQNKRAS
jgi:hypothetical protein